MKKILLILGIASLMVLAACQAQQQQEQPPQDDMQDGMQDQEQDPSTSEETDTPPVPPEPEPEEPETDIEEGVQELIDTAEEKVNSYSFVYVGPPTNEPRDTYHVKGDRIMIEMQKRPDYKLSQPFSHIYINTADNTAVAYCEAEDRGWCPNGVERYGSVSLDKYMVKTPWQWLQDFQTASLGTSAPQFEKQPTTKVEFTTTDGVSGEMHVVNFYGMPGRVMLDNGDSIEFRELSFNSVSDDKVTPPEV